MGSEAVRYLTMPGNRLVANASLISSVIPLVKKINNNPEGVPGNSNYVVIKDGPHRILLTHKEEVNSALPDLFKTVN